MTDSKIRASPSARQRDKDSPKKGTQEEHGVVVGGWEYSREDVCLAAPDKIASLLIKLCSWMSLLNSVVNTHRAHRLGLVGYYA